VKITAMKITAMVLQIFLPTLGIVAAMGSFHVHAQAPGPQAPVSPDEAARGYFTDLVLVTQEGKEVRFYTDVLKDKVVLISFIFTHCQDACPLLTKKLSEVQKLLGDQLGTEIYFVSMSVDPERDTPEDLNQYAKRFQAQPGWVFLTGKKENMDKILSKLGQLTPEVESHSTLLLLGNVETGHWMKLRPDTSGAKIAEHLHTLAAEK